MKKNGLNNKIAAFCMLAKNSASALPKTLEVIENFRKYFSSSRVYIIENDSIDDTKNILNEYAISHSGVIVDYFDNEITFEKNRIKRLTNLRNRYLSLLRQNDEFVPDYLIVLDSDLIMQNVNIARIIENAPSDWAFLSANGRFYLRLNNYYIPTLYYDLFAYVPKGSARYKFSASEMMENRFPLQKALKHKEYVPCDSAFGGMTIYRYSTVKDSVYSTEENTLHLKEGYVCEHIPFNLSTSIYGKGYVCKDLKILYEPITMQTLRQVYESHLLNLYAKKMAKRILKQRRKNKN